MFICSVLLVNFISLDRSRGLWSLSLIVMLSKSITRWVLLDRCILLSSQQEPDSVSFKCIVIFGKVFIVPGDLRGGLYSIACAKKQCNCKTSSHGGSNLKVVPFEIIFVNGHTFLNKLCNLF